MHRSTGFGSTIRNCRPFKTRFRFGSTSLRLNLAAHRKSLTHYAKGTRSSLPCGLALPLVVDTRFQVLFHSPPGVLFTFPSRYLFTIGRSGVFSLGTWSSQLPTGLHVACGTQDSRSQHSPFAYAAITRYGQTFQTRSARSVLLNAGPTTLPLSPEKVWASPPSLAATNGIFGLISSPGGTKMFQFPPFTRARL
jgi:hypothetical protein